MDDIQHADRTYEGHMREASDILAQCSMRARQGLPTEAPEGLASMVVLDPKPRVWSEDELPALYQMRARGRTVGQIAIATKRSEGSVKAAIRHHLRGRK